MVYIAIYIFPFCCKRTVKNTALLPNSWRKREHSKICQKLCWCYALLVSHISVIKHVFDCSLQYRWITAHRNRNSDTDMPLPSLYLTEKHSKRNTFTEPHTDHCTQILVCRCMCLTLCVSTGHGFSEEGYTVYPLLWDTPHCTFGKVDTTGVQ